MDSVLQRLADTAADLAAILGDLEAVIAGHPSRPRCGSRRLPPRSRPPWDSGIAHLILDIHAGVRDTETELRAEVSGVVRRRGGSDANTLIALDNLVSLAAGAQWPAPKVVLGRVSGWAWRGRIALGEAEEMQHLVPQFSLTVVRCPWCRMATLRAKPVAGVIFCINPSCADGEGRRPVARVEAGPVFSEPLVIWQDDTVGLMVQEAHA